MGDNNGKDLVLAPNQYAYISDTTKGSINTWVGPTKVSLSNTDEPVIFSEKTKRFEPCMLEQAKQLTIIAPEGWYIVLKNPEKDGKHPVKGVNDFANLDVGRKVVIMGPQSFSLFPGQYCKVIRGHVLRSNQYLLVRVYDAEAAMSNWNAGVIKGTNDEVVEMVKPPQLIAGQVMVIKGTDVSFYIPPTGIEVLRIDGQEGKYIREAVTLERLEYCVLKDENGDKRYVQGPDVVFPEPTETFIFNENGSPKYRAYELNEISGIYVKVVADYEENGKQYKIGEELFLTGKDTPIYIPRPEHAIISYGDQTIHYAIAIPEGEGRYVLNRLTGSVDTVEGPTMLLPDPRTQVIVKRVLSRSQSNLWFPGNKKVSDYNDRLRESLTENKAYLTAMDFCNSVTDGISLSASYSGGGETSISRKSGFTKPRTITLQTDDYDGVVSIDVWTGYAVKVVDKVGNSKVIVGPTTYLMGYNESLEVMELSSGKPKTTDSLVKTVFLRAKNNKVSDIIPVETKDFCTVDIKVSYNVEFVGDTTDEQLKWFDSDNYVKLLCDRMKSKIRRKVKKLTVEEFYNNAAEIITNTVLGDEHQGTFFNENNMRVFDIEVITVHIEDHKVSELFERNQITTIEKQLALSNAETQTAIAEKLAEFDKANAQTRFEVESENLRLKRELEAEKAKLNQFIFDKERELSEAKLAAEKIEREEQNAITHLKLEADKAISAVKLADKERNNVLDKMMIDATSKAFTEKMTGITPGLIEAMNSLANMGLTAEVAKAVAPYALAANDESVADVVRKLKLDRTSLEGIMSMFADQQ